MSEFRMPSLGADMDAGTLVEWLVKPGAAVKRGDIIAVVETEKGLIDIEVWETGTLREILVAPGAKVPVGTILAVIGSASPVSVSAPSPAPLPPSPSVPIPAPPPIVAATAAPSPASSSPPTPPRASPAARQLAREHGVDLSKIVGTGPHEVITRGDVELAISFARLKPSPPPPPPPAPSGPPPPPSKEKSGMRHAIATAMSRSKREIPHYYLWTDIDVSKSVSWLAEENARRPVTERVLFAALLIKATALALREVPELNGFFVDGEFHPSSAIHVGVAISLRGGGLVAPAIHDTDKESLVGIMSRLADLTTRARSGSLRSSEMSEPTITLTNLGDNGTDAVLGVIYPPQVAIVGFGTMRDRPFAQDGMLGVKPVVTASLSADHRVSDGHRGARFLSALQRLLAQPDKI